MSEAWKSIAFRKFHDNIGSGIKLPPNTRPVTEDYFNSFKRVPPFERIMNFEGDMIEGYARYYSMYKEQIILSKPLEYNPYLYRAYLIPEYFRNLMSRDTLFDLAVPSPPIIFNGKAPGSYVFNFSYRNFDLSYLNSDLMVEVPLVDVNNDLAMAHGVGQIRGKNPIPDGTITYNNGLIKYISLGNTTAAFDEFGYVKYYKTTIIRGAISRHYTILFDGPILKAVNITQFISGMHIYIIKNGNLFDMYYFNSQGYYVTSITGIDDIFKMSDEYLTNITNMINNYSEMSIGISEYEYGYTIDYVKTFTLYYKVKDGIFGPVIYTNPNSGVNISWQSTIPTFSPINYPDMLEQILNILSNIFPIELDKIIMEYAYYGDKFVDYLKYSKKKYTEIMGQNINNPGNMEFIHTVDRIINVIA